MHRETLAKNHRALRTVQDKIASNLRHVASPPRRGRCPQRVAQSQCCNCRPSSAPDCLLSFPRLSETAGGACTEGAAPDPLPNPAPWPRRAPGEQRRRERRRACALVPGAGSTWPGRLGAWLVPARPRAGCSPAASSRTPRDPELRNAAASSQEMTPSAFDFILVIRKHFLLDR